ncbi:hypothetical protein BJ508DRAFT_410899 [Ascobolus immersus RN42]|uniref:Uncharacterized protein n=1 Tax=Ascobolus immersus RN42 TaxID=1160509 RepID=A0A3N4IMQ4_ASCIM|nr:hypothetical protein BJ508DRAFT_410899 [Ascobolus immersus RN42]
MYGDPDRASTTGNIGLTHAGSWTDTDDESEISWDYRHGQSDGDWLPFETCHLDVSETPAECANRYCLNLFYEPECFDLPSAAFYLSPFTSLGGKSGDVPADFNITFSTSLNGKCGATTIPGTPGLSMDQYVAPIPTLENSGPEKRDDTDAPSLPKPAHHLVRLSEVVVSNIPEECPQASDSRTRTSGVQTWYVRRSARGRILPVSVDCRSTQSRSCDGRCLLEDPNHPGEHIENCPCPGCPEFPSLSHLHEHLKLPSFLCTNHDCIRSNIEYAFYSESGLQSHIQKEHSSSGN